MARQILTPKREAFCRTFVECGNASEAYRAHYNVKKMAAATVASEAYKVLQNPEVSKRIDELREDARKRHRVTIDDILGELEEARQAALAAETVQASAATSASMGKAKILGYDRQVIEHTGRNGGPIETVTLSRTEYLKARKAMLADDDC